MNGKIPLIAALTATSVIMFHGCTDESDPTGPVSPAPVTPVPGTLLITLESPNADDGAVSFIVRGGEISNARVPTGAGILFTAGGDGEALSGAILGTSLAGPMLRFDVPDVNRVDRYEAVLLEVSDETNILRDASADYSLSLSVDVAASGSVASESAGR